MTTTGAVFQGRYVYCIMDGEKMHNFGNIGMGNEPVYTISYKDISAVISNIPFRQVDSNIDGIVAHQRVVDAARKEGTVLPVRFGVILKTEEGIKKLLTSSYQNYKSKIVKLRGKDEYGIRVLQDKDSVAKIRRQIEEESEEVRRLKKEISGSAKGESYFLKMKLDDAVRNGTLKKIDQIVGVIHRELSKASEDSRMLKADVEHLILNSAYLVGDDKLEKFNDKISEFREKYRNSGLTFHISGPWAPYSFC